MALLEALRGSRPANESPPASPPSVEAKPTQLEGVVTDQRLLQFLYAKHGREVHAIATDSFIGKSKSEYNSAWLARELIQNFVDHNPQHPGTLDGVEIRRATIDGVVRFTIEGNWPFEDPTGVISPHSDKPEGSNKAGGNGIGLKQTAIRLMRDYNVRRFLINGEGWAIDYRLARAEMVNQQLEPYLNKESKQRVRHDWLLADMRQTPPAGKNSYTIETTDPELIEVLDQLSTLGVSAENPYLKNPDFENEFGSIKWLSPEDAKRPESSRLFVNGQVMNFKVKGDSYSNYWKGPEGVTIRLNDITYRMSIDRPPVTPYDLGNYIEKLTSSMSKQQLLEQIKRAEALWAGQVNGYSYEKPGYMVVVEKLLDRLKRAGYTKSEYEREFSGRKYLYRDSGLSEGQSQELRNQGYTLCDKVFETLGMPSAASKLDTLEVASNTAPVNNRAERERFAKEHGLDVSFENLGKLDSVGLLAESLRTRLIPLAEGVVEKPEANILVLNLATEIPKDMTLRSFNNPNDEARKILHYIRGLAASALSGSLVNKIYLAQKGYLLTFTANGDYSGDTELLQRLVEVPGGTSQLVIEFKPEDYETARSIVVQGKPGTAIKIANSTSESQDRVSAGAAEERPKPAVEGQTFAELLKGVQENLKSSEDKRIPWTKEEETLYQAARAKPAGEQTEADRVILAKRRSIIDQYGELPISFQPARGENAKSPRIITREAGTDPADRERLAQLERQLPGIVGMVNELDRLIPEKSPESQEASGETVHEKYLRWRKSGDFYGQLAAGSGYLTGRHLVDIMEEYNQADIPVLQTESEGELEPARMTLGVLEKRMQDIMSRMSGTEHEINDFEMVVNPTENRRAQLGLLRFYVQIATGADVPNDLFIYQGSGSKGINLNHVAIGLHESLFNVDFSEALRTFVHEIAHNEPESEDHGNMFRHIMESLFAKIMDRQAAITDKLIGGEGLSKEDKVVLDVRKSWDALRTE